ncbi:MAG: sigma-54 dependent transcriptional regulator [Alphaproteobacteria bacterium]
MRLLIVGRLGGQIGAATKIAIDRGARVAHAGTIDDALDGLRAGRGADLAMVDVGLDIERLIGALADEHFHLPVVACGVDSDAAAAVRAIRAGAKEYIPLPPDAELMAAVFAAVTEEPRTIVHRDPAIVGILRLADQVAPSEATILVTGESGTGKELLARYVHNKSRRASQPFITISCAAIPENLLESELFGHEKGAFTGAVARRVGKFEEATGGTLLLDEISEMDLRLQAKLLRAIQEREIDRVGGGRPIKVDIRVIATSNRDLAREVAAGRFREDLYFRLNVVTLTIPPLRARPSDIIALAEHFARKYAAVNGVPPRALDESARQRLLGHGWPGNVRELENTIHRAVLLAKGPEIDGDAITLFDRLGREAAPPAHGRIGALAETTLGTLVGRTVADVERDLILETLGHCLGNRTHAATILGISIRTLRNKLRDYAADGARVPAPGEAVRAAV